MNKLKHKNFMLLLFLCCMALGPLVNAQDAARVDAVIQLYPDRFESPEDFSRLLSRDFDNEEDKVRAIYGWLITHVAYEPEEYQYLDYNFKNYRERNEKEERKRNKIILRTLQQGVAVCEGYAMTFEKLCELQGISSYLVRGDVKTNFEDIGRPFKKIHMWNLVTIAGQSYLFDPTWGAGIYRDKFIRQPNWFYYKTPPELFIKTHYPHLYEDALLEQNITHQQFSEWPLIIAERLTPEMIASPGTGIITSELSTGTIDFQLQLEQPGEISYSYGDKKIPVQVQFSEGATSFSVPIELGSRQLLIFFNDQPALGYTIK